MKKIFLAFIFVYFALFLSCSKDNENIKPTSSPIDFSPPISDLTYEVPDSLNYLKDFLSNNFNYKNEEINYIDNEFVIQSDMALSLDKLKKMIEEEKQKDSTNITRHRAKCSVNSPIHSGCFGGGKGNTCDRSNEIYNIYVWISSGVLTTWKNATINAMNEWNNLSNNRINFIQVNGNLSCTDKFFFGIRVFNFQESNTSTIARAEVGYGTPGDYIKINTLSSYFNSTNINALTRAMTHELGHSIGYYHTDESQGCFITGSNANDNYSVMKSYIEPQQVGFSQYDISAHNTLYPMANNSAANIFFGDPSECN